MNPSTELDDEVDISLLTQHAAIDTAMQDLSADNLVNFAQQQKLMMLKDDIGDKLKLSVLNSISGTAVAIKRIASDDNNSGADRAVAGALTDILKSIAGNPFMITSPEAALASRRPAPEVPAIELVADETSTTLANIELAEITG